MAEWIPPTSLEERLKEIFVPGAVYIRYLQRRERRKGEREYHLLPYLVDPSRNALDIGANQGVWTFGMLEHCPKVFAFEPNPKIFRWLKRNISSPRAALSPIALSDASGEAQLRVPKGRRGFSNQGASLSEVKVDGEHEICTVQMARLDDMDVGDVGFMKVDVEGFELSVLKGAKETIARCKPTLIIEMEERHTAQPIEDMLREVEAYGYDAFALSPNGLTSVWHLDFDACHRNAPGTKHYVFNFIFLPRS